MVRLLHTMRSKACVTVSASGMHSVCVCEIHQNVKLLLAAVQGKLDYKDVMSKLVCNIDDRNCMLHECDSCPGKEAIAKYLTEQFKQVDMDDVMWCIINNGFMLIVQLLCLYSYQSLSSLKLHVNQ